jgi:hypothetical protein
MKNNYSISLIAFYEASVGGHGAAEVTLSFYDSLNFQKKKLFEIKKYLIFKFLENIGINIFENIFKLMYLINLNFKIIKYLNKNKNNIAIIEGASWIGYSYITIKILKFFKPETKLIYHSHNIEYYLRRKKNNLFISFITKILERKVYQLVDVGTAVSKKDKNIIKKLYSLKVFVLNNGINKKRLAIKKFNKKIPKDFIIFTGSYSFLPNKQSIDLIAKNIFPKIIKKYPNMKLVITGRDFPIKKFIDCNFIYHYKNINKHYLNYLLLKSKFLLAPMFEATGTKLKIIEALMLGAVVLTSKEGVSGLILPKKNNPPFIFDHYSKIYKMIDTVILNNKVIKKYAKLKSKFFIENYNMKKIVEDFFIKSQLLINYKI